MKTSAAAMTKSQRDTQAWGSHVFKSQCGPTYAGSTGCKRFCDREDEELARLREGARPRLYDWHVGDQWSFDNFAPVDVIPTAVGLTIYAGESTDFMQTPFDELIGQSEAGLLRVQIGKTFSERPPVATKRRLRKRATKCRTSAAATGFVRTWQRTAPAANGLTVPPV